MSGSGIENYPAYQNGTCVPRFLIIFAVFLCYYQSWVDAVDCEKYPYHPECRGMQARKRSVPLPVMRAINCDEGGCRVPRLMIAIFDNTPYRSNEIYLPNFESNSIHLRNGKNRIRLEDLKGATYLDDY
ncbi:hypothetical protein PUN28_019771 [Cardiocondyla obscurior]|uniref:Uncharacterized protein n=1 Tax=Cardiocondyla obscurior TaxID=286306 RepID=A0AAW2E7B9_9HYME